MTDRYDASEEETGLSRRADTIQAARVLRFIGNASAVLMLLLIAAVAIWWVMRGE